jgi:tetratricopeptide (TPR) repeat protein
MNSEKIKVLCWSVLLLLLFAGTTIAQDYLPELVRQIKPSAVAIETFDANGKTLSRGSGFFIDTDKIVTNRHVIEKSNRVEIHLTNGGKYTARGILAIDGEGDLAILQVSVPPAFAKPLPIVLTTPEEGESIVVIGNPYGLEGSVSNGIVSAVREIPGYGKIIQITAPISPGSSGSPVVNMRGQVIGVATLQADEGQGLNFAVPSERISQIKLGELQTFATVSKTTSQNKRSIAEKLYSRGLQHLSNDDYAKALPYFEEAVKSDPNYAEAWYQVGFTYGMLGKHNEALKASEKAAKLRPELAETYINIGASSFALDKFKEAAAAYKTAAKLNQNDPDLQFSLGLTYNKLGSAGEEILAYRRAIELKPDHAEAIENLGLAYFKQKRYAQAIQAFINLQSYKSNAETYNYLGESYLETQKFDESINAFTTAVNMNSGFEEARYNLGRAYLKQGKRDMAQIQYEILQANSSDWADKLYILLNP